MEQIGEGGMGLVFVAVQRKPVYRKVALDNVKIHMQHGKLPALKDVLEKAKMLVDSSSTTLEVRQLSRSAASTAGLTIRAGDLRHELRISRDNGVFGHLWICRVDDGTWSQHGQRRCQWRCLRHQRQHRTVR